MQNKTNKNNMNTKKYRKKYNREEINDKKGVILYKDKTKKYLDFPNYEMIYESEKYSVVYEKDTFFFYLVTFMERNNGRDMYYIDIKSKICRSLGNDCYAVGLHNKEIMYNALNNCFIGESHDRIYPCKFYDNCTVIANQDYLNNGKKTHLITSYSNFDGKYLGNIYDNLTEKYYNPEKIDYSLIISDIRDKFIEKENKVKKKVIKKY